MSVKRQHTCSMLVKEIAVAKDIGLGTPSRRMLAPLIAMTQKQENVNIFVKFETGFVDILLVESSSLPPHR